KYYWNSARTQRRTKFTVMAFSFLEDCVQDALRGFPVTKWANRASHLGVCNFIMDQTFSFSDNLISASSDESRATSLDCFRSLGFFSYDQNRFAQGWSFFLDSAGICNHQ